MMFVKGTRANSTSPRLPIAAFVALALVLIFSTTSCQNASSGGAVQPPALRVSCTSGPCATTNGSKTFIVYATQAGCSNPEFSALFSTGGFATCSAGVCLGSSSGWIKANGDSVTSIASDNYDFCGIIYFNGGPNTGSMAGDIAGTKEDVRVETPAQDVLLTDWTEIQ